MPPDVGNVAGRTNVNGNAGVVEWLKGGLVGNVIMQGNTVATAEAANLFVNKVKAPVLPVRGPTAYCRVGAEQPV